MSGKVSWLDSCSQESKTHITSDDETTLCGYPFTIAFKWGTWTPYRVSKKRGICRGCLSVAKSTHIEFKSWSSVVPERDITKLPNRVDKRIR